MIELATAALVAKMAADAVGAFDKIFRGYTDFLKKKEPSAQFVPPPDFEYVNSPDMDAIIAQSRSTGHIYQTITYAELQNRLNNSDRKYIETLTRSMEQYQNQWNLVFEQRSMAGGIELGRLDSQLDFLSKEIAETLIRVLDFVKDMGMHLDDHYLMARSLSRDYLRSKDTSR